MYIMPGIINFFLLSSIQRSFVVVCMRGGPRPPNVSLAFNTPLPARPEGGPCYNPTRHIHNEGPSFDRREVIDDISRHIPSTYYTYNTTMFPTLSISMPIKSFTYIGSLYIAIYNSRPLTNIKKDIGG